MALVNVAYFHCIKQSEQVAASAMNRNTPSQLLREALLEYSREKKVSRSRREGNRQPPDQVDQTHENAFSDVVLTDKDDVEMGMASTAPEG